MRRARWVILVAIIAGLLGVSALYQIQKGQERKQAPIASQPLPGQIKAVHNDWQWTQNEGGRTLVEVRARNIVQVEDHHDLEGVDLRLFHKDGKTYDQVKSA